MLRTHTHKKRHWNVRTQFSIHNDYGFIKKINSVNMCALYAESRPFIKGILHRFCHTHGLIKRSSAKNWYHHFLTLVIFFPSEWHKIRYFAECFHEIWMLWWSEIFSENINIKYILTQSFQKTWRTWCTTCMDFYDTVIVLLYTF